MLTQRIAMILVLLTSWSPGMLRAQRQPLSVEPLRSIQHEATKTRLRIDPVRRTYTEYAVDGRIEFQPESGNFVLSWQGYDGTRQRLTWEPPSKLSAIVEATVSFDEVSGLYTYSYSVQNLATSVQRLKGIYVEAAGIERASAPPGGEWYSTEMTPLVVSQLGIPGWAWIQFGGTRGILPGQRARGFQIVSRRPPAVVKVFVEGRRPTLRTSEDLPEELHAAIDAAYFRLPAGTTIGPAVHELRDDIESDMRELLAMFDDSRRVGWFGSHTSADPLRGLVMDVGAAIADGDTGRAERQVSNALRLLDTMDYNFVLSEAKALLHHRLRLIRDKLR